MIIDKLDEFYSLQNLDLRILNRFCELSNYSTSHGANKKNHVGLAPLYFSLIYGIRAKKCVCLGSGDGFIPKIMALAQYNLIQDKILTDYDISLVDANIKGFGERYYEKEIKNFSQINVINQKTDDSINLFANISYLHIDADHTEDQVYKDLCNYGSKMINKNWIITCHDSHYPANAVVNFGEGVCRSAREWVTKNNCEMINLSVGFGTIIIAPKINGSNSKNFIDFEFVD